jgi:hypothetical protein
MRLNQLIVYFIFLCLANTFQLGAQTGIGTTTPNSSAKLDVSATDKGFLPPRIALTATNVFAPITGTADSSAGLLIYNTATTTNTPNNVVPGYYYWNGTAWIQIAGGLVIDATKNTSFSLSAADNNKLFFISSASAVTVTVPTLPIGFSCQLIQTGSGSIVMSGSNVVILNSANGLTTRSPNSVIGLVMNSTTTGYVFGDTIF